MSKIGQLKTSTNPKTPGVLSGNFATLNRRAVLRLEPNERKGESAPDYIVYGVTADGDLIELGAAWKRMGKGERPYLSIAMDDADWKSPLSCAAFQTDQPGEYEIIQRRDERAAAV